MMKIGSTDRSPRSISMHDRASVRGVKRGRPNRRRGSGSVLESSGRTLSAIAKGFAIAGGVTAIGLSALWCHRFAMTSKELAIASIEVHGQKRASKESIVRLANVEIGSNIFAVDVDEVAKNVGAHPWVKQARVARRYPRTLAIEIVEHEPAVLVALGHLYYANKYGEIVKRYSPGEHEDLPIVTGLSRDDMESDDGDARARLRSAIVFLEEMRAARPEAAPKIAEIHLDPVLGLSFVAGGDEASVLVGLPPWKARIARLFEVEGALEKRGVHASRIMLGGERRPDRATARLAPEALSGALPSRASGALLAGSAGLIDAVKPAVERKEEKHSERKQAGTPERLQAAASAGRAFLSLE
jgi:cell division protein FtsQ